MKKILITGGNGYVGSELVALLTLRNDIQITVVDNLMVSDRVIPELSNVRFIEGDIRNYRLMKQLIDSMDVIVHLAAIVGEPACVINKDLAFDINVNGIVNIIKHLRPKQHLIFASTSSVYGDRPNEVVTEYSKPNPINNYARQKELSERHIKLDCEYYTILRPVTAFGASPNMRLDVLVNTLLYDAITAGKLTLYEPDVIRPIIHVQDYVRVLEWAIDNKLKRNEVYNVGNPLLTMTKAQLIEKIATLTSATITHVKETSLDLRNYDVSFDKLMNTGFRCVENSLILAHTQIQFWKSFIMRGDKTKYQRPDNIRDYVEKKGL